MLRHHGLYQLLIAVQLGHHLVCSKIFRGLGIFGVLQDKLKPLIELALDHLAVFQEQVRVLGEFLLLFGSVVEVRAVFACEFLRKASCDPCRRFHPCI